jgi:hypothetical protein
MLAFGLLLMIAPTLTLALFGVVAYQSTSALTELGADVQAYLRLAHAVIGAVMVGWSITLLALVAGPFRRGERFAWWTIAGSMAAWFVPDTLVSLTSGFAGNAVLNLGFALLFAIPLAATWREFTERR